MGYFRAKRGFGDARDPDLPLSVAQAQRLRNLVRVEWARMGREVSVHPDYVADADGGVFGLWNLAATVAKAPARKWPRLVAAQVQRLAGVAPAVAGLSDSQLHAQLGLRLAKGGKSSDEAWYPSAPVLAGDLRQALVVDLHGSVVMPSERDLAARGDLDQWRAVGRANLWHLMRSEHRDHEVARPREGGHFDVLTGDSPYTASMAVFLPELLSLAGRTDLGRGVFVSLPFSHQLAFRVIDGPSAAQALPSLLLFAMAGYGRGGGPLSPHVFWVRDGQWDQITDCDSEGARIVVGPELAKALGMTDG